ncbi:hypothetical protein GW915_04780 [bacterium]|nr:hypothetical protein [bacterium]
MTKKLGAHTGLTLVLLSTTLLLSPSSFAQRHKAPSESRATNQEKKGESKSSTPRATFLSIANQMLELKTYYVYNGNGPKGWDCSHATTAMINKTLSALGKDTISYRTSTTYRNYLRSRGLKISCREAKPGDLIGWSGHIGLVYDSNNLISSHSSGGISKANFISGWASNMSPECFSNPWF